MAKVVEESIYHVGKIHAKQGRLDSLKNLFVQIRPFFDKVAKAKSAKITRQLIDQVAAAPGASLELQSEIVSDAIAW